MSRSIIAVATVVLVLTALSATASNTQGFKTGYSHEQADTPLKALSFLTGTWQGRMGQDDFVEEVWSEAKGGAMMGMFRWLNAEGRPRMYEILTITSDGADVFLRLRHFSAEMIAWEERDAPIVLKMRGAEQGRAEFVNMNEAAALSRIVFFSAEDDGLGIDVLFKEESGRPALHFRMKDAAR